MNNNRLVGHTLTLMDSNRVPTYYDVVGTCRQTAALKIVRAAPLFDRSSSLISRINSFFHDGHAPCPRKRGFKARCPLELLVSIVCFSRGTPTDRGSPQNKWLSIAVKKNNFLYWVFLRTKTRSRDPFTKYLCDRISIVPRRGELFT